MESQPDFSPAGTQRARKIMTRAQLKQAKLDEQKREQAKQGLGAQEYWKTNVKCKQDVVLFYKLYYPDYPDVLTTAIATRIDQIIQKSQAGEDLTDEEKGYYTRSQLPPQQWDWEQELRCHENAGKINVAIQKMEELKASCD